jgi:hypothetical protein
LVSRLKTLLEGRVALLNQHIHSLASLSSHKQNIRTNERNHG